MVSTALDRHVSAWGSWKPCVLGKNTWFDGKNTWFLELLACMQELHAAAAAARRRFVVINHSSPTAKPKCKSAIRDAGEGTVAGSAWYHVGHALS